MKGDPLNPADWQKIALIDLARAIKTLAGSDLPACTLWLQQAAEKALKGWLIGQGWTLVKTHDLRRLTAECAVRGLDLGWFALPADQLTGLYFEDRYLSTTPDPEPDEAECRQLLADVERLTGLLFPQCQPPSLPAP